MQSGQPGTVVVTGAAGNLGTGVVARLHADGVTVLATVQDETPLVKSKLKFHELKC